MPTGTCQVLSCPASPPLGGALASSLNLALLISEYNPEEQVMLMDYQ